MTTIGFGNVLKLIINYPAIIENETIILSSVQEYR